jgi:hypothetical protein
MKKRYLVLTALLMTGLLIAGCTKKPEPEPVVNDPTVTTVTEPDETENKENVQEPEEEKPKETGEEGQNVLDLIDADYMDVSFYIVNLTGVDIGMVACIDPITNEQVNAGGVKAEEVIVLTMEWPIEETVFNFAVYNKLGELVSESKVDITGVTKSVTITLSGDHSLDSVTSEIK